MKTYIQLGRAGDILNILPLLWLDWKLSKEKSALMVAEEFAGILDGVSYVEPVIYPGPHFEIREAVALATSQGRDWVCTQVNGPMEEVRDHVYKPAGLDRAVTTSFQKEMWRVCGRLKDWDSKPPLVFDRRSPEREAALLKAHQPAHKPFILVAASGNSSPFPYVPLLMELIKLKFGKRVDILDLGAVKAERIYDLLALYERANCLVAIDSAPLHLARAVPALPVVALVNDKPLLWNGSSWQPEHIWFCRYSDFPGRAPEMLKAIDSRGHNLFRQGSRIIHVWNAYKFDPQDVYKPWLATPIELGACGRDSTNVLQDTRRDPFLKDAIRMAIQRARDGDIICMTRSGTQFEPGISEEILKHESCFSYRMTRDSNGDTFEPIVDLFAARRQFWKDHLGEIPDMVFGTDYYWSHALWALFFSNGAHDSTGWTWRAKK